LLKTDTKQRNLTIKSTIVNTAGANISDYVPAPSLTCKSNMKIMSISMLLIPVDLKVINVLC